MGNVGFKANFRGAWMAQSVKCYDLHTGHDLMGGGISPFVGLCAHQKACLRFSPLLLLSLPAARTRTVSLK